MLTNIMYICADCSETDWCLQTLCTAVLIVVKMIDAYKHYELLCWFTHKLDSDRYKQRHQLIYDFTDFNASVSNKLSSCHPYVKVKVEDVRFTQIDLHVQSMGRNSHMLRFICPGVDLHETRIYWKEIQHRISRKSFEQFSRCYLAQTNRRTDR